MAATAITLDVVTLDVRTGLWCDACRLPSVIEIDFVTAEHDTLRLFAGKMTSATCDGCGPVKAGV